jgi:DNA-3-methyladenine glycosylase I
VAQAKKGCGWETDDPIYIDYHDCDWGVPVHDDQRLFEMLVLEGAQAGLSWITILKRREGYRRAFASFDPARVARFDARKVAKLLEDKGIIRNRAKVASAIRNAKVFLEIQQAEGSFDRFIWDFVGGRPRVNSWKGLAEIPAKTEESLALSKALAARGMNFVGPTICYALMQSIGMVNDHLVSCFRHREVQKRGGSSGRQRRS